jgi:hypothetical protein
MPKYSKKKRALACKTEEPAFLPWFLDNVTRHSLRKLMPRRYFFRLRIYFEKYGCMSCHRKKVEYHSYGTCKYCNTRIAERLKAIDLKLKRQFHEQDDQAAKIFLKRLESAKSLLGDLRAIMENQPTTPSHLPW